MPYVTTVPVLFPCSRAVVYRALCDLKRYPLWNNGMLSVSEPGPLHEGMHFESESIIAGGQVNRAQIEVVQLQPNESLTFESRAGAITYRAGFRLTTEGPNQTTVVCDISFEFNNFVLKLTRGAIEAMASARIRGDLESLRALICEPKP